MTEIIGSGRVDMGFKAMIHTLAVRRYRHTMGGRQQLTSGQAKARGFPVTSIGSLLDEPFTGVVYLKDSGITTDFRSLKGKRIGYVGEFGKVHPLPYSWSCFVHLTCHQIQIDELTKYYGMTPDEYTAVRCGMNVSKAIIEKSIDAGIGLENVQMVELEEWLAGQGRPRDDVQMLRIDELAELGCCCFCSILYIGMSRNNAYELRAVLTLHSKRCLHCQEPGESSTVHASSQEGDTVCSQPARAGLRDLHRCQTPDGRSCQPQDIRAILRLFLRGPQERSARLGEGHGVWETARRSRRRF